MNVVSGGAVRFHIKTIYFVDNRFQCEITSLYYQYINTSWNVRNSKRFRQCLCKHIKLLILVYLNPILASNLNILSIDGTISTCIFRGHEYFWQGALPQGRC